MKTVRVTLLLVISYLSRAAATSEGLDDAPCRTRAWVRAPNLEPGQIVQGHVKVKLDGACDNVSSYRLGLRFAERSWVKTRRTDATLPSNPYEVRRNSPRQYPIINSSDIYEPENMYWPISDVVEFDWDQYKSNMKNPDLWLVREEERIAFETRYPLKFDAQDSSTDIVRSFALLVPFTIYPPVFNTRSSSRSSSDENSADTEHSYMYFVDVTFSNGTHREVGAGYTSFSSPVVPFNGPMDRGHGQGDAEFKVGPESVNVTASGRNCDSSKAPNLSVDNSLEVNTTGCDTFTMEIIFPEGRHFEQGSTNNISIKSHQIGPGLARPLSIQYLSTRIEQKLHWAAKHAADNKSAEALLNSGWTYDKEIWPEANDDYPPYIPDWSDTLPRFSQEAVVQNGTMYSTEAVSAQFKLPPHAYPSFEMYYQTSEVKLTINMAVRNVSGTVSGHKMSDKEEYDWVPMLQDEPNYGVTDVVRSTVPIYVHRKPEYRVTRIPRVVHYLSPEARAPVFVDPSNLAHLLQMTAEDRDTLAPLTKPRFTSQTDGDVVRKRYFPRYDLNYVGHTWLRKVVAKGMDKPAAQQDGTLIVQT